MRSTGSTLSGMSSNPAAMSSQERSARLFDVLADSYDAVGVDFFQPIAQGLIDACPPRPGDAVADLGCGKGAFLLKAADAVGRTGRVVGIDISPVMVGAAARAAEQASLHHVEVVVGDAQAPDLPAAAFDLVASSVVLFFLPDPGAAVRSWRRLLAPGGRLAVSTFGPQDDVWRAIDGLFDPYLPADLLDARASGRRGPFGSDEGMAELVAQAGFDDVRTVTVELSVHFADADHWHTFSLSTGQRAMWQLVPEPERAQLRHRAEELLATAAAPGGGHVLRQQVRYTVGTRST